MALRIAEPNLFNTERLLGQILTPINKGEATRVAVLCDPGDSEKIIGRLRVMLTRKKSALKSKGKKVKAFTLHTTVHNETRDGKRHECIVFWTSVSETHLMSQELEDMLSHG